MADTTTLNPKEQVRVQALQAAGKQVDENINQDAKFPELWDLFTSGASSDYTIVEPEAHFRSERVLHLPEILLEQYERVECRCFMGIFPEINRAWVTIDNQLFLWSYEDESDFSVYNGLDQVIVSVGLVSPKPNIFVEDIKYLLVLTTPVEIILLAVCFEGNSIFGELSIHPTQLSLPTDNVNMLKIVGTQNGRIFLGGKDGCLYELYYQADDGWFSKRCRKINHSKTILSSFVPSIFRSREDPVIDIVVDEARHVLYTLSFSGNISVYDLGEKGDTTNLVCTVENVTALAEGLCPRVKTQQWNKAMKVKSIYVVPQNESKRVHLVAITSTGIRLYFTTAISMNDSLYESTRPSTLEMVHVRLPPDSSRLYGRMHVPPSPSRSPAWGMGGARAGGDAGAAPQLKLQAYEVDTQFYNNGVALMADSSRSEDSDSILVISPDLNQTMMRGDTGMFGDAVIYSYHSLLEKASPLVIEGKVWSISEVPLSVALKEKSDSTQEKGKGDGTEIITSVYNVCNELSSQHFLPPRRFLLLTNAGLHIIVKRRPIDILEQLLLASGGKDTQDIISFFEKYTRTQASAMCLALAARSTQSSAKFNQNLVAFATQAFFKYGGTPHLDSEIVGVDSGAERGDGDERRVTEGGRGGAATGRLGRGATMMGQAVMRRPEVIYSDSHNGFALYLARLLMVVWNQPIEVLLGIDGGLSVQRLVQLEQQLLALVEFLDNNPNFAPIPSDLKRREGADVPPSRIEPDAMDLADLESDIAGGSRTNVQARIKSLYQRKYEEEAKRMEQRSLGHMHLLLRRAIEQLAFLTIFRGHEFERMYELLPQKEREATQFRDLITSPDGFEVTRQLVNALMGLYTESETGDASTDSISKVLRTRCPSIFQEEDRIHFKADELLHRAKKATSTSERLDLLRDSLKFYLKIAGHLYRDMPLICENYQFLHFREGVVDLALRCAQEVDPSNLAVAWFRSARGDEESVGKKAFDIRQELYSYVISVFDELWLGVPPKFNYLSPEELAQRRPVEVIDEGYRAKEKMQVLQIALSSKDELFHVLLYQWFIQNTLTKQLLEYCIKYDSPYIENFLDADYPEILANYYILVHKYVEAAGAYLKLAAKKGENIPLGKRVEEYLARAISCAKSCKGQGELLHELQEKMDVAQIQLKIQDHLRKPPPACRDVGPVAHQIDAAIASLDEELFEVSDLYNKYAKKFGLWECCLEILKVSGHNDPALTKKFWENIILEELFTTEEQGGNFEAFPNNIEIISRSLFPSEIVFPTGWLCNTLEIKSYEYKKWKSAWVFLMMRKIGVSHATLFDIYNSFFDAKDSFWNSAADVSARQMHILRCIHGLVSDWIDFRYSNRATSSDVTKFRLARVGDQLDKFIMALGTIPGPEAGRLKAAFEQLWGKLRMKMEQEY